MNEPMQEMLNRLIADGVVSGSGAELKPLTGGVSSEIYLVTDGEQRFVVKRALEKLKVKADWFADVSRNESEFDYIKYVSLFAPESVPQVIAKGDGYFAMEYLDDGYDNWKQLLFDGVFNPEHARMAGSLLARVHAASIGDAVAAKQFDNGENFWDLRIEPYIEATGKKHPELLSPFEEEAARLRKVKQCLVHGDFSPKNMLISGKRLVALDCEVANFGDPVFDVCFLLTHLLLKALWYGSRGCLLKPLADTFIRTYRNSLEMTEDQAHRFSLDSGRLLSMLLLARVDGKSPVEYITDESTKAGVRHFVYRILLGRTQSIDEVIDKWFAELPQNK